MSPANRFQMPLPERPFPLGGREERAEPFARLVEGRELPCASCGIVCRYESASSPLGPSAFGGRQSAREESGSGSGREPRAECRGPIREFLRARPDVWLALVVDPKTETLEVVATCSEPCVQKLLRE